MRGVTPSKLRLAAGIVTCPCMGLLWMSDKMQITARKSSLCRTILLPDTSESCPQPLNAGANANSAQSKDQKGCWILLPLEKRERQGLTCASNVYSPFTSPFMELV